MALALFGVASAAYLAILWADRYRPARRMPRIRGPWRAWGVLFFAATAVTNAAAQALIHPLFRGHSLLPGGRLGDVGGALVGFLLYDFVVYWAHRAYHRVPFLWRWVHQMHHAPERMDPAGMAFFHPLEMALLAVTSAVFYDGVLGLTAQGAATAGVVFIAFGIFQHANLRTPRWVGYFIQRPEAHGVHHQRGLHGFNYSDVPLWDILFGTFRNPEAWEEEAGFYPGALRRWPELLAGRNIGAMMEPHAAADDVGRSAPPPRRRHPRAARARARRAGQLGR